MPGALRPLTLGPVGQFLDPSHDPDGDRPAAGRAAASATVGGGYAHAALPVAVEVVLALLGVELDGPRNPSPVSKRGGTAYSVRVKERGLPPEGRGVRI